MSYLDLSSSLQDSRQGKALNLEWTHRRDVCMGQLDPIGAVICCRLVCDGLCTGRMGRQISECSETSVTSTDTPSTEKRLQDTASSYNFYKVEPCRTHLYRFIMMTCCMIIYIFGFRDAPFRFSSVVSLAVICTVYKRNESRLEDTPLQPGRRRSSDSLVPKSTQSRQ